MKTFIASLFVLILSLNTISAQDGPKVKFGKVETDELKMTVYEPDTTAEAVILYDDGNSEIRYDLQKGFILYYSRFVRVKILKQSGTQWGNFSISLYSSTKNKEELQGVKGVTFNLENGKVEKTEMKKEAIFRERENKYWEMARLSLPAVKVGSVIDLKYDIASPLLWNLRSWDFQYLIPVKWSQYRVAYPEYFVYNHAVLGYHPLNSQNQSTRPGSISYTTTNVTAGSAWAGGGQRQMENNTIKYNEYVYDYTAKDVPAMKEEPYLTTLKNYTTQVKFELSVIDLTKIGGSYKNYTSSWNTIADELISDEDFGGQIKSANYAKDEIAAVTKGTDDVMKKIVAIYSFVQHNVKWNGYNDYTPTQTARKTFNEKTGNSADINLLLTAMLNEAGIETNPVLLSTRKNGIMSPVHATLSDCNYVIARTLVDGKPVLLDATEPNLPAGLLPFRCLNGTGRLIKRDASEEVALTNRRSSSSMLIFVKPEEGKLTANFNLTDSGLEGFNTRESLKAAGGQKEYFEKLKNKSTDFQYLDYAYENIDSIYKPLTQKYNVLLNSESENGNDVLYFNPILVNRLTDNPFSAPKRSYPIDFGAPFFETYQLNLTIPEGYKVEEIPQPRSIVLPDKSAAFRYSATQTNNNIVVSMLMNMDKTLFLPEEYKALQDFYNLIIAKESEQIVLKKIN